MMRSGGGGGQASGTSQTRAHKRRARSSCQRSWPMPRPNTLSQR